MIKNPKRKDFQLIFCWIEIDTNKKYKSSPTIWMKKPSKRETKNAKEFGYEIYPAVVSYNKRII